MTVGRVAKLGISHITVTIYKRVKVQSVIRAINAMNARALSCK